MTGCGGSVLVVNAGSSSIKLAVFAEDGARAARSATVERIGSGEAAATVRDATGASPIDLPPAVGADHAGALAAVLPRLAAGLSAPVAAVGHRVVHGGGDHTRSVLIDGEVTRKLEALVPLARTHQPHALAGIRAVAAVWPGLPQVACFDTGFHATMPEAGRTLALPAAVRQAGVRRYGFHGLSYRWVARALPGLLGDAARGCVVAAHLGNGASLCGMVGLRSRATTMGFTPLDGLVMGERPGATDPGAILFMLEEMGMDVPAVREALFRRSGLLGLSGLSNDMRVLLASPEPAARLAVEVYVHRAVREIGAVAAEIGGIDALVFTGGVGENAAPVRAAIVERLGWLGFRLDRAANAANAAQLQAAGSAPVVIVPANEEAVIAADTRGCVLA